MECGCLTVDRVGGVGGRQRMFLVDLRCNIVRLTKMKNSFPIVTSKFCKEAAIYAT